MPLAAGRHAGLLVPLFSIPSRASWGIGEIGDIPAFASWLREAGLDLLQLLPIGEMAIGQRSPYSAMTAMAIDPIFISVHAVAEFRALGGEEAMGREWQERLDEARRSAAIDHALVRSVKEPALRAAFGEFERRRAAEGGQGAEAFDAWAAAEAWWLDDYALFRALHADAQERPWRDWPAPLARAAARRPGCRRAAARRRGALPEVAAVCRRHRSGARRRRAPGRSACSATWRSWSTATAPTSGPTPRRSAWTCRSARRPTRSATTGQNWGMPAYRWDELAARDFDWLRRRARRMAALYDGYRVDHLVGFYRTYMFSHDGSPARFDPADEPSQLALGETVLSIFNSSGARILAEDLGTVPDFVRESLARLGVPGCKVFRWERHWDRPGQPYRDPAAYPAVSVATSGTHDTDPMAAWWDGLDAVERAAVLATPGVAERVPTLDDAGRSTSRRRSATCCSTSCSSRDRTSSCCRSRTCSAGGTGSTCPPASTTATGPGA